MANGFESLRKLADVLSVETARTSGDPQRLQLALGEAQARKLQETETALNQAIDESNIPDSQKRLLKALDYQSKAKLLYEAQKPKEPKERRIVKGPDGFNYYVNPDGSFERVFPGLEQPKKEETASQMISKEELAVLNKIKSLQDQIDAGTLILEEGEQITDKLNQYEKLILQSYISRPQQQDSFAAFAQYLSGQNDDDLIIKKVE
jgi:hypothetical protein